MTRQRPIHETPRHGAISHQRQPRWQHRGCIVLQNLTCIRRADHAGNRVLCFARGGNRNRCVCWGKNRVRCAGRARNRVLCFGCVGNRARCASRGRKSRLACRPRQEIASRVSPASGISPRVPAVVEIVLCVLDLPRDASHVSPIVPEITHGTRLLVNRGARSAIDGFAATHGSSFLPRPIHGARFLPRLAHGARFPARPAQLTLFLPHRRAKSYSAKGFQGRRCFTMCRKKHLPQ